MAPAQRPIAVLLVEDNPADVRLTEEALRDGKVLTEMRVAKDGVEAMELLRREGRFEKARRPDLILLDLNLPRNDGREVLAEIKADESLRRIPVVVLTSSTAELDIFETYNLHANCYVTKPLNLAAFMSVVWSIEEFWLTVVRLPAEGHR